MPIHALSWIPLRVGLSLGTLALRPLATSKRGQKEKKTDDDAFTHATSCDLTDHSHEGEKQRAAMVETLRKLVEGQKPAVSCLLVIEASLHFQRKST